MGAVNRQRLASGLRSARLALALLIALAAVAAVGSFGGAPEDRAAGGPRIDSFGRLLGLKGTFGSPLFLGLTALLTANVLFCTVHRLGASARDPRLRATDALLHLSLVLVIAGGAVKAAVGFVGTQNVAVGTETRSVFDWKTGADVPLGFALRVERLETRYHPFRARIGLSEPGSGRKLGIVEVSEVRPGAARAAGLGIDLRQVDRERRQAVFAVRAAGGEELATLSLDPGPGASAEVGGVRLTLVAYRDEERMVSALVNALSESGLVTEQWLSPNGSLSVGGTDVFLTAWGRDEFGNPFAGFQVTRDPGAPLFWAGCIVLACAVPLHLVAKRRRAATS